MPLTIEKVSSFLNEFRGLSDTPLAEEMARRIVHQAWDAKVHAEAALMQWISSEYVGCSSLLLISTLIQIFLRLLIPIVPGPLVFWEKMLSIVLGAA